MNKKNFIPKSPIKLPGGGGELIYFKPIWGGGGGGLIETGAYLRGGTYLI